MENNTTAKAKKGLNLMGKILLVTMIPLLFLTIMAGTSIRSVGKTTGARMAEHELHATTYAMEQTLEVLAEGDFSSDGNSIYKGDVNLSENEAFLDQFREATDVDVTIFWGDTRMATSIKDKNGNRVLGTKASASIYEHVMNGGTYFVESVMVEGKEYYGYYDALKNTDGTIVGMVFTGMEADEVHAIYESLMKSNVIFMVIIMLISCGVIVLVTKQLGAAILGIV